MITMYRGVILLVFLCTASAIPDNIPRECFGIHHSIMRCCTGIAMPGITQRQEIKDCFELSKPGPAPPNPCEVENCIGQKFGYYGDNGLDKQAFASFVEKKFDMNKDLVAAVKENCVNADISSHGPPDMCDIIKLQHCFDYQLFMNCPEWSNEGECKALQDEASRCFPDFN